MTAPTQGRPSPDTTIKSELQRLEARLDGLARDAYTPAATTAYALARGLLLQVLSNHALFNTQPPSRSSGGVESVASNFADAVESLDEQGFTDHENIWESGAAMGLTAGDIRFAAKALSRLATLPHSDREEEGRAPVKGHETFETIRQWCEDTFGPVTPERIAARASEEMDELRADPTRVEEAADVVIVLLRYPDLWAAVERKMAVNRARKWRLMGDGTGYHVKDAVSLPASPEEADHA